jgi:hypothetical protein
MRGLNMIPSDPKRVALLTWLCAALVVLAWWWEISARPDSCPEVALRVDYAACVAPVARIADAVAPLLLVPLLGYVARRMARAWWPIHAVGAIGTTVAAAGALALALGIRPGGFVAWEAGWAVFGVWCIAVSATERSPIVSFLGLIIGATFIAWALGWWDRDDMLIPLGGRLFAIPFAIWSVRVGGWVRSGARPLRAAGGRARLRSAGRVVGIPLLLLLVFPFWIGSTYAEAVIGDPAIPVTLRNATTTPVRVFPYGVPYGYPTQVEVGESRKEHWLQHGYYHIEATDTTNEVIFCREYAERALRLQRYVIEIVHDTSGCSRLTGHDGRVIVSSRDDAETSFDQALYSEPGR